MEKQTFKKLVNDLAVSHTDHNMITRNPFYVVQSKETNCFINACESDFSVWVDSDNNFIDFGQDLFDELPVETRNEINDKSLEEEHVLFNELSDDKKVEQLKDALFGVEEIGDLTIRHCVNYWQDRSWYLTYQEADQYIKSRQLDEKTHRIYVYSLQDNSLLWKIINGIKNGDIIYSKKPKAKKQKKVK